VYPAPVGTESDMLTYLTDSADPAPGQIAPKVGDSVELRFRLGGRDIEAWSATGIRLGRLPPAEREALDDLLQSGTPALRAHISAVVPRPLNLGRGRIHIRVQTPSN
jgi:hypothetical protein